MDRRNSFMLRTMAGVALTGVALLRDMFTNVTGRVNGFEHQLRSGRYTGHGYLIGRNPKTGRLQYSGTRGHTTEFPPEKRNGAKERERRLKRLNKQGLVSVTFVGPHPKLKGKGALARDFDGVKVRIQMNDMNHPHAHGWHVYNAALWAVGYHGRIDNHARYVGA